MWPFSPKTLLKRYNNLIKLILSIDSHFVVTENTKDSVRLHLPNYKGNQTMDFHIYLLDSFLYVSFETEIEGEKVSVLNKYHQSTDQQVIFNDAMSNNMSKIRQVINAKYQDEIDQEESFEKKENEKKTPNTLNDKDYLSFNQRYSLYYFVNKLCSSSYYNGDVSNSNLILNVYKQNLGLSGNDEKISAPMSIERDYVDHIKSIETPSIISFFLFTCVTILDESKSDAAIACFFTLTKKLGISEDEIKERVNKLDPVPCEHFFDRKITTSNNEINGKDKVIHREFREETVNAKTGTGSSEKTMPNSQGSGEINNISRFFHKDSFDFNASFQKHALTIMIFGTKREFFYYSSPKETKPLWMFNGELYCDQDDNFIGASAFVWLMQHYDQREDFCYLLDILDNEIAHLWVETLNEPDVLINEIKRYIPSFKLGNDPQRIKTSIEWAWIDIKAILNFINYCTNTLYRIIGEKGNVVKLKECTSIKEIARLFISDFNLKARDEKTETDKKDNTIEPAQPITPIVVKTWSLIAFATEVGGIKYLPRTTRINPITGKYFETNSCAFFHPTEKDESGKPRVIYIEFSSNLKDLTPEKIVARKNELIIVKYDTGTYELRLRQDNVETEVEDLSAEINNLTTKMPSKDDLANAWTDKFGVKYSADRKRLLKAPEELKEYEILEGTIIICDYAFSDGLAKDNRKLSYLTIPNSVNAIGKSAFFNCRLLESIIIPNSVKSIGDTAFFGCDLSSIIIPPNVCKIGVCAFGGMNNLISIIVDRRNKHYDSRDHCNSIIDTAQNTLIIGCSNSVIPNGVARIGRLSFSLCKGLKSITIPNSVSVIEEDAFSECSGLCSIKVDQNNSRFDSRDNCNAIIDTKTNTLIIGCQATKIPTTVKIIGNSAFQYTESPSFIKLPESVNEIGDSAFSDCKKLTSIILPNSVKRIGERVFEGCENLSSVTISSNLKEISKMTFISCNNLSNVVLPYGLKVIGFMAFANCRNLKSITIPNSVTTIDSLAFRSCSKLESLILPNSVTEIGDSAFECCYKLTSIVIPDSVNTIGYKIFSDCYNLQSIIIPVGTKEKFMSLFPGREKVLVEREYPENLRTVVSEEDLANAWTDEFGVIYSSNKKRLLKGNNKLSSYRIRSEAVTICDGAFEGCILLKSVFIPNSIIVIGDRAFKRCSSIENINLPKSVASIGNQAFASCSSLVTVSILEPVNIGDGVFDKCHQLESIYYPSKSKDIDLHEFNDLIDRTKDYPFICSWSIDDFCRINGEMQIEEGVLEETGENFIRMVFINSFSRIEVYQYHYLYYHISIRTIKEKKRIRIGQDSDGDYWYYDKTSSLGY